MCYNLIGEKNSPPKFFNELFHQSLLSEYAFLPSQGFHHIALNPLDAGAQATIITCVQPSAIRSQREAKPTTIINKSLVFRTVFWLLFPAES